MDSKEGRERIVKGGEMRSERDSVEEMEVTGLLLISLLSPSPCIPGDTHGYTMGPAARA